MELQWLEKPVGKIPVGKPIEPAPTLTLLDEGDPSIMSGEATARLRDGRPIEGATTRPIVEGVVTFPDLVVNSPGPTELVVECDTDRLHYPGMSPDDPNMIMCWKIREEDGLAIPYDAGPMGQVAVFDGPPLASEWSLLGPAWKGPGDGSSVVTGDVSADEYRNRMYGDLTVAAMFKMLPWDDLSTAYYDMVSIGSTNRDLNGTLINIYVRKIGANVSAVRFYWQTPTTVGPGFESGPLEGWLRIVMVRTATSSGKCNTVVYLNGEVMETATGLSLPSSPTGQNCKFYLGQLPSVTPPNYFQGSVAEVAILDRALSPAEVAADAVRCGVAS